MIDKYEKPFNEEYYNGLKKLDVKQAVRYKNPYVYLSSKQRNEAKKDAEDLLEADKKTLETYRKNKYVYPLIERETNFQVTWKTKLRDLRFHHRVLNRCPIGGLELVLANSAATYSHVQWVVASHQPEVNGMDTARCLEHWEDHAYHFTEQYHPQCFDSFWRKDIPEGHFDMVRPGIMLYGYQPSNQMHYIPHLKPALTWKARVAHIKTLPAGRLIGYDGTFELFERPTKQRGEWMSIESLKLKYPWLKIFNT